MMPPFATARCHAFGLRMAVWMARGMIMGIYWEIASFAGGLGARWAPNGEREGRGSLASIGEEIFS
jgi:hypothetical protein